MSSASSPNLTVKVHPLVYMTIVDSYERRKSLEDRSLGTLLGYYEKNVIRVTNCYAIPFRDAGVETPEINDSFNRQMLAASKRAFPNEQIVGWFFTVSELPECCAYYHSYYATLMAAETTKKELPPVILLTMDVTFTKQPDRLPVNAFIHKEGGHGQTAAFLPLRVEMDAFLGESVALGVVSKTLKSERRETELPSALEQINNSLDQMLNWTEQLLKYVNGVLASGKLPEDPEIGRKLVEVITQACTQIQPEKLENLTKTSLRDYLMVDYLAKLTKSQLALQDTCLLLEGNKAPRT